MSAPSDRRTGRGHDVVVESSPHQLSLLNDEPVTRDGADLLGAGTAARQLAGLLVGSRASTPFTLAVDAGWGTGKSSLMRLVDAELAKSAEVHTVWYNAWTSTGADALEGLIKSVLMRFDRRVLRRALHRVSERGTLVRAARALSVLVAGPLGVAGLADELWKGLSVGPQARNEMRDALRDLTREWAQTGALSPGRMLVVFIDDLDRCAEETVLAVCEAVKVYLDVPGLAFVIGCDRSVLTPSGLLRDLSPAGSAFMEKIFQTSYRIPVPDEEGIEEFVRSCARDSGIHTLLNDALVSLIAERCGRNPRRIKKLVNGFVLEVGLNPLWRDFGPRAVDAVVRTLLVQHLYPGFYRMLIGSAHGDVLAEFLTYRKVRRTLRRVAADEGHGNVDLAGFFTEHEVRPPQPIPSDDWETALAELEAQLPSEFPALAADRGFTSLIEDLMELPQSGELIQRLRQQPRPRAASPAGPEEMASWTPRGTGAPEERQGDLPLQGLRILWIDDNADGVEREAQPLRRAGARVAVVPDAVEAERHIAAGERDLLISDITRGADQEAGFTGVRRLRESGLYTGPVIFYTGRVTPARETRARSLGALGVTNDPHALWNMVKAVARGEPGAT